MKRFFIVIAISIVSQVAVAQWKFTVTVSKSGNCSGLDGAVSVRVAESMAKHYNEKTYSSSQDCEAFRAIANGVVSDDGCKVRLIAGPCSGPGGAKGGVDVLGVGKGTSFYSVNGVNEINDWSNDDMERMLALNPEYNFKDPKTVATGDIAFDNLIEKIPYSDEAFSGRMPRGSTNIELDENIIAIGQPVRGNGVLVPDDFTDRPFTGLGVWSSDDLKSVNVDLKPVRPLPYPKEEAGISDFWFDLAGDVAKTAKDVYDISKVLAGTATTLSSAAAIGTAVLADVAINLVVEDAKAYYKVYKGESVTTGDIFKNTLEKSSMGLFKVEKTPSGYTKGVIDIAAKGNIEHYVKEGTFKIVGTSNMEKGLAGPGVSIATRTAKYGNMLYDKLH